MIRKVRKFIRNWWECRTKQCSYYQHYLAYGPAELTHEGYHAAERLGDNHFKNCTWNLDTICPACKRWELRLRA